MSVADKSRSMAFVLVAYGYRSMTVFDTVGLILAGFIAVLATLHVTLIVVVLAYSHIREAIERRQNKVRAEPAP